MIFNPFDVLLFKWYMLLFIFTLYQLWPIHTIDCNNFVASMEKTNKSRSGFIFNWWLLSRGAISKQAYIYSKIFNPGCLWLWSWCLGGSCDVGGVWSHPITETDQQSVNKLQPQFSWAGDKLTHFIHSRDGLYTFMIWPSSYKVFIESNSLKVSLEHQGLK